MTTFDLVGTPFPKDAPLFASDDKFQKKLSQLESFIEMYHDLQEVRSYLSTAVKIQEDMLQCQQGLIPSYVVRDALAVAAIVLYAKLFNASQGRTVLNRHEIFADPADHDFFIDVRDKFLAHQEWNANQHQVFFFQKSQTSPLRMNPFGQTERIPVWPNLDWERFTICIRQVDEFVKGRIDSLCKSIQDSLSAEQSEFLNTASPDELFQSNWNLQPNLRKNPFSSRVEP